MSRPLLDHLAEVGDRVASASGLLLYLDFDGTLAPIAEGPSLAELPPATRELLAELSSQAHVQLAIISGRSLADVQSRVGLPPLIYAGNHGLEICGQGFHFVEPVAAARAESLGSLSAELSLGLRHIPGIAVENKGLTASIHFRRVAPAALAEVTRTVVATVAPYNHDFVLTLGKKVFEIRPRVDWDKGSAARWINDRIGEQNSLSVYIGDDETDEDAFAALTGGITVRVGLPAQTRAEFHLAGPAEVYQFLRWLARATRNAPLFTTPASSTKGISQ